MVVKYYTNKYLIPITVRGETISFKFDTGASNTVVSIRTLFPKADVNTLQAVCNDLKKKGKGVYRFIAADGGDICGVWCVSYNAIIDGERIPEFYYNLILDANLDIALLGDDFISGCDFEHTACCDIDIKNYDINRQRGVLSRDIGNFTDLDSIKAEIDSLEGIINEYEL